MDPDHVSYLSDALYDAFAQHPEVGYNEDGQPQLPADALVEFFRHFADVTGGLEVMTPDEEAGLEALVAANPGIQTTPDLLLNFIAARAAQSASPPASAGPRGRGETRGNGSRSRDSSLDSSFTGRGISIGSRPPSRGPPQTPARETPLDRRLRSTPLGTAAPPSSWSKPVPAARRKSIDNGKSDSESPSAYARAFRRSRAGSNAQTPLNQSFSDDHPPGDGYSRPASRQGASRPSSRPGSRGGYYDYGSPHDTHRPPELDLDDLTLNSSLSASSGPRSNSIPLPSSSALSDSDSDDDGDAVPPAWHARGGAISSASIEDEARMQALIVNNDELTRKLREAEETIRRRMEEHEQELEELTARLDECRSELRESRREEKELRAKERSSTTQIGSLETEIQRMTRALEQSRTTYQALQKQYQEQLSESERYRNTLRSRDQEIKDLTDQAALHGLEGQKWAREQVSYEERLGTLEADLATAQGTAAALDDQKQENMMLKETIDRLRFEMDELRVSGAGGAGGASEGASRTGSMSRSWGAELARRMGDYEEEEEERERSLSAEAETVVEGEGSETESEDVVQTIITRKKKRMGLRSGKIETHHYEETREYADAYTQYEVAEFVEHAAAQTDPEPVIRRTTAFAQTSAPRKASFEVQTEPEPALVRKTTEMEIQTEPESEPAGSSSSSTATPPTPKGKAAALAPVASQDLPPAYEEEESPRAERATLAKWHAGAPTDLDGGLPAGVSPATAAEWDAIKAELGVGCAVLDRLVASSERRSTPASPGARSGRLLNVYNTYVYGAPKDGAGSSSSSGNGGWWRGAAANAALCALASAATCLVLGPALAGPPAVPGGPTYYDRLAWQSFNDVRGAGEGFGAPDGTAAFWDVVGRLGGGAARTLRGWPT